MQNRINLEHCQSFINYHLQPVKLAAPEKPSSAVRAVTISREAGAGAAIVASKVAELLQEQNPTENCRWTVFDRNLMAKVLEDHHLSARMARYLPEDRLTELQDITDELFGVRPASWTVIQQTSETILSLVELGNVIIIGRGGNVITAKLPNVIHVRLVAPLERRIENARRQYEMSERDARAFCLREDLGRSRYLRKYFNSNISDPLLYHLVINTGLVSHNEAARLIASVALERTSAMSAVKSS
jgi:cytidylate kinase